MQGQKKKNNCVEVYINILQHTNWYKAKSKFLISCEIKGLTLHEAKIYTETHIMVNFDDSKIL